ncbi:hypothetical protein BH20CHL7_BH20CHL7_02250 [soil metagenome]
MADLPLDLPAPLAERLARALDVEGKIPRALDALGPVADRDVVLVDGTGGIRARQLTDLGARVAVVASTGEHAFEAPDGSADALIAYWSAFRGELMDEIAHAQRILRPGGRLLVVHDYGRDDVSRLMCDRPEYGAWSRRNGPFLANGFRVRVVHCFWTFDSLDETRAFLTDAFVADGEAVMGTLQRPRLSYNIAVYHRTVGEEVA